MQYVTGIDIFVDVDILRLGALEILHVILEIMLERKKNPTSTSKHISGFEANWRKENFTICQGFFLPSFYYAIKLVFY